MFHNSSMTDVATADIPPSILVIGGLDPTSGAGITADSAAIRSLGGHPLAVLTASTAQNTNAASGCWPVTNSQLAEQLATLLSEWTPSAVKIGLVATRDQIAVLVDTLQTLDSDVPIVIDPVGFSSTGTKLSQTIGADWAPLLRFATVLTPNHQEALSLSNESTIHSAAVKLTTSGNALLLTCTDANSDQTICHRLYLPNEKQPTEFNVARQSGSFHGSGCSLASAIAFHLASDSNIETAVSKGLYNVSTWMNSAFLPSENSGQKILRYL